MNVIGALLLHVINPENPLNDFKMRTQQIVSWLLLLLSVCFSTACFESVYIFCRMLHYTHFTLLVGTIFVEYKVTQLTRHHTVV
jgi:hypothetical protein